MAESGCVSENNSVDFCSHCSADGEMLWCDWLACSTWAKC